MTADTCPSCGSPLTGEYCANCGQERIDPRDETLSGFARNTVMELSPVDGRFLPSLRDLIFRPGLLTRAWIEGRRRVYLPALQLFLVSNLLFFVIGGLTENRMFTQPLRSQLEAQAYSSLARDLVRAKMTGQGAPDYNRLAQNFDLISDQYARALVFIMVPLFALAIGILQFRRGRAAHHIVFSLHYYAFVLILYQAVYILLWVVLWKLGVPRSDPMFGLVAFGTQIVYLGIAFRRAYRDTIVIAIAKALVASFCAMVILQLYRFILFLVVLYAA